MARWSTSSASHFSSSFLSLPGDRSLSFAELGSYFVEMGRWFIFILLMTWFIVETLHLCLNNLLDDGDSFFFWFCFCFVPPASFQMCVLSTGIYGMILLNPSYNTTEVLIDLFFIVVWKGYNNLYLCQQYILVKRFIPCYKYQSEI